MASLKGGIFDALKKEGYIIPALDKYLLTLANKENDRAPDVNAPSALGKCLRALYYSRKKAAKDGGTVDARAQRIFDNGDHVHDRLQTYLADAGILLQRELPVHDDDYNIHGHTDGIVWLQKPVAGVLEIKSINSKGFAELTKPKPEHKIQGLSYLSCIEKHRLYLHEKYPTERAFKSPRSIIERRAKYAGYYQHMKDGHKYTREQKIEMQVNLCMETDDLLYALQSPVETVVFLYENKDDQHLKEYAVNMRDSLKDVDELFEGLDDLEKCIKANEPPRREGTGKTDYICKWCDYRVECWG